MPERPRYRWLICDSARWDGFVLRPGDIIISTPPKCGTTWTQMICALLVFQTPDLPRPLDELSPWLDMLTRSRESVVADLDAQTHRRFIKTHTPLDGLPWDERVTYVVVGRDPRDAGLSWDNHMENLDAANMLESRAAAVGLDDLTEILADGPPARADSVVERFWVWVDDERPGTDWQSLGSLVHHLDTFWAVRNRPNVVMLHYSDLKADLEGTMRELAARLSIDVPEAQWPTLVDAARFESMRARADDLVPGGHMHHWQSNEQFFNKGTSGQWTDLLDDDGLARYTQRVQDLGCPEVSAWLHRPPLA